MVLRQDEEAGAGGNDLIRSIVTDIADAFNETIASKLREMADVLEQQQADGFRITAYRRAAATVESLASSIGDIAHADGLDGLMALPAIGSGIAMAITEMLSTGRWSQLERLRSSLQPEQLFQSLPGVGPELAARIHGELHIDTLEALELAAHDGRLAKVPGLGHRRVAGIRAALTERLGRQRIRALLQAKSPAGCPSAGRRPGVPGKSSGGQPAPDRTEKVQPDRRGMAARLPYGTGALALYGVVLEHAQGA